MIDRAGTVADVRARKALLRAAALADRELRTFGTWSVAMATALGDATRPRPRPAPPLVEREPEPVAEPVAERMTSPDDPDGRFERLERYQLEQRVAVLGADHPDVALLLYLIGTRCAARGAPQEAVDLYRQALQIQERAFGINSAALKPLLIDLAEAERIVGLEEDAADHDARSLALDEAHLPQIVDEAEDERGSRPRLELLN